MSIIDFKGMGIPYTLGSSDSSMLFYDIVATSYLFTIKYF
ncbi:hypothetical protein M092_0883 [Parabacteroides distasonis str. 3776 D15 iv]|uniref:Uncharacterized protein n=1 Tax=Parabacteroides distasonis str. 3776 D15 i TaxID=1339342 RepID=A0AB34LCZ5_PARDI|nr:hypothetical protein M091_3752 [Parabacteroides distasonis str. 3776 D15 i]KDS72133.1 hypothetical protein M092_0883 [Parabacteroides distasonis str. 3776 D15 iv]